MNLHNQVIALGFLAVWMCLLDVTLSFPSLVMPRLHRSVEAVTNNKIWDLQVGTSNCVNFNHNLSHQKKDELMADEAAPLVEESLQNLNNNWSQLKRMQKHTRTIFCWCRKCW
ncbi:hypothetical protein EVAR_71494_1 [Eumeta japonica]|uniref:Uncharacterized protein n=1 Tax=Eumeta variegata TaxID=151549 RepID=A0A4C2AGJ9_EUMVA|nr:hypothetical protein EVAR_71494_1 [Eumeta japonica]